MYNRLSHQKMKHWKLSNQFQDYFWGVMFTVSALMWIWVASLFI